MSPAKLYLFLLREKLLDLYPVYTLVHSTRTLQIEFSQPNHG